jgi:hypothetical protein
LGLLGLKEKKGLMLFYKKDRPSLIQSRMPELKLQLYQLFATDNRLISGRL